MNGKIYLRSHDKEIVYLQSVVTDPSIEIGDYTIYNTRGTSSRTITFLNST